MLLFLCKKDIILNIIFRGIRAAHCMYFSGRVKGFAHSSRARGGFGECGSRLSQMSLNLTRERMCAAVHAPRGPSRLFERRHGLAEIIERGGLVHVERPRVSPPHPEREIITLAENASRHGNHS